MPRLLRRALALLTCLLVGMAWLVSPAMACELTRQRCPMVAAPESAPAASCCAEPEPVVEPPPCCATHAPPGVPTSSIPQTCPCPMTPPPGDAPAIPPAPSPAEAAAAHAAPPTAVLLLRGAASVLKPVPQAGADAPPDALRARDRARHLLHCTHLR
jgi:hypothetical protein